MRCVASLYVLCDLRYGDGIKAINNQQMYVQRSTEACPDLRILDATLTVVTFTKLMSHSVSHNFYTRSGMLVL